MGETLLVKFELCRLDGTGPYYVVYTFAPHWRVEDFRAALAQGLAAISQVPQSEKLESFFHFTALETFEAISLLGEMRRMLADPNNARFTFTSAVGMGKLARELLEGLVSVARHFYPGQINVGFCATMDEALDAMRQRVRARTFDRIQRET